MKPIYKGLIIAIVHVLIVSSLGAKLLYDRATRPRAWALTAPYDPSLPIRGRYARLRLAVEPRDIEEKPTARKGWSPSHGAVLRVKNDRLVAEGVPDQKYDPQRVQVRFIERQGRRLAVLDPPVAFFIPEHVPDPSRRAKGEELWVEVTIPRNGPPRPIRLGVKKGDGPIVPLDLN